MTYKEAIEYLENHYMAYVPFLQENREQIVKHNKTMDIAIDCIKRQIPQKPLKSKYHIKCVNGHNIPCVCRKSKMPYCPFCGQAIDWE